MPGETLPPQRVHGNMRRDGLRLGGALWIVAGLICAGLLIFVFLGEGRLAQNPGLAAMVLCGAVVALVTGGLLVARPGRGVARWSAVVGVVWLLAFGSLAFAALSGPERGPMLSSGLITGFGVGSALLTFRAARSGR